MALKYIEVTVKLLGDDYKETIEAYSQRINYEYFQQTKPNMVAQIAAVVNDLPIPTQPQTYIHKPWPPEELYQPIHK